MNDPRDVPGAELQGSPNPEPGGETPGRVRLARPKAQAQIEEVPLRVAFRDLLIFQLKLVLDGLGDIVLSPVSVIAFVIDVVFGRKRGRLFYSVLRAGEGWDRWLRLYRPAKDTGDVPEGLLEAGLVDADSFLGRVEEFLPGSLRARPDREQGSSDADPPES